MAENKVKFGLSNVHIFKIENESGEEIEYASKAIRLPGAVNLSLSIEGEENTFYADDIPYFQMYANNGYSGDLEIALLTEEFLTEIMGQRKDKNGAIVESADDIIAPFAMSFEFQGDARRTRNILYKVVASRPNDEHATIAESKEPQTETLSIKAVPRSTDRLVKARIQEGNTGYDTFYDSVYEPSLDDESDLPDEDEGLGA
ncbi:major tail protein [Anaerococcus sp. AGMB09787]|uniref:major tail protein n=1 Tax=Anaerococcus sp. AGMB09787 TaxID=2922869 RepID=UPI001FAFEA8D|nr:major tail protein [Anaerococcus sp. AGMB09787]